MADKQTDTVAAAVMAAPRAADAARALSMPGRTFREIGRKVFGVYVSEDPTLWTPTLRAYMLAYVRARGNTAHRAIIRSAWIDAGATPRERCDSATVPPIAPSATPTA